MSYRPKGPLKADHPLVTMRQLCPVCDQPFLAGDLVLLRSGEPAGEEDAEKRRQGGIYTAVGIVEHWECGNEGRAA